MVGVGGGGASAFPAGSQQSLSPDMTDGIHYDGFISRGRRPWPSLLAALIEFTPGSGDEMGGKHMPLSSHAQQAISSLPLGSGL